MLCGTQFWRARDLSSADCVSSLSYPYPLFDGLPNAEFRVRDDWLWLVPSLFAQAGIAEEVTFRGYLFRHLRKAQTFWCAGVLAMIPLAAVHVFSGWRSSGRGLYP